MTSRPGDAVQVETIAQRLALCALPVCLLILSAKAVAAEFDSWPIGLVCAGIILLVAISFYTSVRSSRPGSGR